jgi:hypothetical protein
LYGIGGGSCRFFSKVLLKTPSPLLLFRKNRLFYLHYSSSTKGSNLKQLASAITLALFMAGCSEFTFQPEGTPPKTEHDKLVRAQQEALAQQQETTLNE